MVEHAYLIVVSIILLFTVMGTLMGLEKISYFSMAGIVSIISSSYIINAIFSFKDVVGAPQDKFLSVTIYYALLLIFQYLILIAIIFVVTSKFKMVQNGTISVLGGGISGIFMGFIYASYMLNAYITSLPKDVASEIFLMIAAYCT